MVVKTYPTPSAKYGELVCTAGIDLTTGQWMPIYPYPFRGAPAERQFEKYDILRLSVAKSGLDDPRPDSYKLMDLASVELEGHLDSERGTWARRLEWLLPTAVESIQAFQERMLPNDTKAWGQSIGLVRINPGRARLIVKASRPDWTEAELVKLRLARDRVTQNLFRTEGEDAYYRDLQRIPFEFRLRFQDMAGVWSELQILDWEIARLFLRSMSTKNDEANALEDVRIKLEDQVLSTTRNTWLVVGSIHHRFRRKESIAIDGFIWPTAQVKDPLQERLF